MEGGRGEHLKFVQVFVREDREELAIPQTFTDSFTGNLSGDFTLKDPSGAVWKVGLTRRGNTCFFKDGWKEFADGHSLVENSLLTFTYKGQSHFDVMISLHERLFLNVDLNLPAVPHGTCVRQEPIVLNSSGSFPQEEEISTGDQILARIRPLELARDASSRDSLIAVMQSKQVSERFQVIIPSQWAKIHKLVKSQSIILQTAEKSWKVRFYKRPYGGSFTHGWKKFATDNRLQLFDICLFNIASGRNKGRVFDVCIFRLANCGTPSRVNACSLVDSMSSSNMATIASAEEVSDSAKSKKTSLAIAQLPDPDSEEVGSSSSN